jgi:hypothetical protein
LTKSTFKAKYIWVLIPVIGTIAFLCLYVIATFYYPGGSQTDKKSIGFSWINNYWCNLLNEYAINGQYNTARPMAMSAMIILCIALALFWYIFPQQVEFKRNGRLLIQISGAAAMTTGIFLFTRLHDNIINAATLFGLIATFGTLAGLLKLKWKKLFWYGMFNLVLIILNNILYYGDGLQLYLPVVQKITFLYFLVWICMIDIQIFLKILKADTSSAAITWF